MAVLVGVSQGEAMSAPWHTSLNRAGGTQRPRLFRLFTVTWEYL